MVVKLLAALYVAAALAVAWGVVVWVALGGGPAALAWVALGGALAATVVVLRRRRG